MTSEIQGAGPGRARVLLRRGRVLEGITLGWKTAVIVAAVIALLAVMIILHVTGVVGAGTNG